MPDVAPAALDRAARLRELHPAKHRLGLERDRLSQLDQFLREEYGIGPLPAGVDWWGTLRARTNPKLAADYRKLWEKVARVYARGEQPSAALDRNLYDAIASPSLFGLVHSQKRHIILDTAAFLTRVIEVADVRGDVLDVGCNGGYHATWLAEATRVRRVLGIDASQRSIRFALEHARTQRHVSDKRVSFEAMTFPSGDLKGPFELVYCAAGPIDENAPELIGTAAHLLEDNGVLVLVPVRAPNWVALLRGAAQAGLGAVLLDVVGGWGGDQFDAAPAVVFVKGAQATQFVNPDAEATYAWNHGFNEYANGDVPSEEKTQAFHRLKVLHAELAVKDSE